MPLSSLHTFALVALVLTSLCAQSSAYEVIPGDVDACLAIADAIPGLKTMSTNPWTEENIRGCVAYGMGCLTGGRVWSLRLVAEDGLMSDISGTFPETVGALTRLSFLRLSLNLTGTLPSSWSTLNSINYLHLQEPAVVSGSIPSSWSGMASLRALELRFASNEQPIELPLFLKSVSAITIHDAVLSEFPSFMGFGHADPYYNSVRDLILDNVKLLPDTGGIPPELFQSIFLATFSLTARNSSDYGLGTKFPPFADRRDMYFLSSFTLSGVGVGGTIPQSLMDLPNIKSVSFNDMPFLTGDVPGPTISNSILREAHFSKLELAGSISSNLLNAPKLKHLSVVNCHNMTGGLPEIINPTASIIENLHITSNPLIGGTVPSTWVQVPKLQSLHLSNNGLNGTIPLSYGQNIASTNWSSLILSGNQLNGALPALQMTSPSFVDLTDCGLSSTIPTSFGTKTWKGIYLNGNHFYMCANAGTSEQALLTNVFNASGGCALDNSSGRSDCRCLGTWPDRCFADTTCPPLTPIETPITSPINPSPLPASQPSSTPNTPTMVPASTPYTPGINPTSTIPSDPETSPIIAPFAMPSSQPSSVPDTTEIIPLMVPAFQPDIHEITPTTTPAEPETLPIVAPSALPVSQPSPTPNAPEIIPTVVPTSIPAQMPSFEPTGSASSRSFGFRLLIAAALAIICAL